MHDQNFETLDVWCEPGLCLNKNSKMKFDIEWIDYVREFLKGDLDVMVEEGREKESMASREDGPDLCNTVDS